MNALGNFFTKEWYFSAPMTLMALAAFTLVIWRWLLNNNSRTNMDAFLPDLQTNLKQKGTKAAVALCKEEDGLIPNVMYVAGLEAAEQGVAAMRRSMASAVELQIIPKLNFLLAPILATAKIATMVGLLGTVISMINTFNAIAETKGGNPSNVTAQAGAIGLALFATAFGLMTAIPLVFCHVMFKAWIANFEVKMKSSAQQLIVLMQNVRKGPIKGDEDAEEEPEIVKKKKVAK